MVFPCHGGPQDDIDLLVILQKCRDFLSLNPLSHGEILATIRTVLHGSAHDRWETVRERIHTSENFQGAFLRIMLILKKRLKPECMEERSHFETVLFCILPCHPCYRSCATLVTIFVI